MKSLTPSPLTSPVATCHAAGEAGRVPSQEVQPFAAAGAAVEHGHARLGAGAWGRDQGRGAGGKLDAKHGPGIRSLARDRIQAAIGSNIQINDGGRRVGGETADDAADRVESTDPLVAQVKK